MSDTSSITRVFNATTGRREAALIVYLAAGYPDLKQSMDLVKSCADHGADIIEIGIPFSDPVADGVSIQYASQQALEHGVTLTHVLNALENRDADVPIVIMSYMNPILAYGWDRFLQAAKRSRVAGLIVPDLPVEEAFDCSSQMQDNGIDLVLLAAPTSSSQRLERILATCRGFIYCVSTTGTTGVRSSVDERTSRFLQRVRTMTEKPCAVGFGISGPEHIRVLRDQADGVIVGSRIIEAIRKRENVLSLITAMKQATRR